jgi:hypothetical protein
MSVPPPTTAEDVLDAPLREQLEVFLDEHRSAILTCLDGLTEGQARRRLVPSKTTLLGLVKHCTFVEKVWFDEAITHRTRAEIGIAASPDEAFDLDESDTIASVRQAYADACEASRAATRTMDLDDVVSGNRRGPMPLRWVYLHMLRELAQHCGHADILREQLLADAQG